MWFHLWTTVALLLMGGCRRVISEDSSRVVISAVVNPRKVSNYISKEFVCFSAEPGQVFAGAVNPVSETSFQMAHDLGPMYLKVYADSSQIELVVGNLGWRESELVQITPSGWKAFNQWAQQANVVPIFVVDYNEKYWKPKQSLKVLTIANKLGINNCLWQLGSGNVTNAVKYVEDLRAFQAMVKAFNYWGIVATEVDPSITGAEQARYFHLNVDEVADAISVNYEPTADEVRLREFVLQRESYFRGPIRSQLPIWLDVKLPATPSDCGSCDQQSLHEGLRYATLLGDAARNGFNAVFKTLSGQEIQTYSFTYLIGLLHKLTVGSKVFDVAYPPLKDSQIYAYCGGDGNGSLTLYAVNHGPEDIQYEVKSIVKKLNTEVQKYALTILDGQVLLNGEPYDFGSPLEPETYLEQVIQGLHLDVPAFSIVFFVIPNLYLRECYDDYQELRMKFVRSADDPESAVDQLLQDLIAERAQQDVTQLSRRKRDTDQVTADGLAENLTKKLAASGAAKKAARRPRQTQKYRLKERMVRLKEKRAEKRTMQKQKRPLRERGKRQMINRVRSHKQQASGSKKTKRSFMAEAVNQPPLFAAQSHEEEANRSSFPKGDVYLVISKGSQEEQFLSVEEAPIRPVEDRSRKNRKRKIAAIKIPREKDLGFLLPEAAIARMTAKAMEKNVKEMDTSPSVNRDRYLPLGPPLDGKKRLDVDREWIEITSINVDKPTPLTVGKSVDAEEETSEREPDMIEPDSYYYVTTEEATEQSTLSSGTPSIEPIEETVESEDVKEHDDDVDEEHELDVFTDNPSISSSEGFEETAAVIEELPRRRRSTMEEAEIDQLEEVLMNNTQLHQRFTEMLEMLLKSFNCCNGTDGTEAEDENNAQEKSLELDTSLEQDELVRVKRNVLLHPQSWESRERKNLLHQQQISSESSNENMIPTESNEKVTDTVNEATTDKRTVEGDQQSNKQGKTEVKMVRSVTSFLKGISTGLHKVFSTLFPKSPAK